MLYPGSYNASSGGHEINITVNGETITRTLTVLPKDFGTVEAEAEEPAADSANAQFRSAIWRCTRLPPPPSSGRAVLCPRLRTP